MTVQLIYLHGFQSSPNSVKAQLLSQHCAAQGLSLEIPDLNLPPKQVLAKLDEMINAATQPVALIGSSLGGFYAQVLAARHNVPAVLINPAMQPWQLFQDLFDVKHLPYRVTEHWQLDAAQLADLEQLALAPMDSLKPPSTTRQTTRLLVLLQSADETLDYRQAERYYRQAAHALVLREQGGDHAMHNFAQKIPLLLHFLKAASTSTQVQTG